jgi:hypothetical protein
MAAGEGENVQLMHGRFEISTFSTTGPTSRSRYPRSTRKKCPMRKATRNLKTSAPIVLLSIFLGLTCVAQTSVQNDPEFGSQTRQLCQVIRR